MSTAEILSLVSLISYIVAGACLLFAIFFWFFFKIPSVIGDLSGRTAKKSIEKMRKYNDQSGNKAYRSSATNAARGKITDTMHTASGKNAKPEPLDNGRPQTGILSENRADGYTAEHTEILGGEATGMLVDEEATTALNTPAAPVKRSGGKKLTMLSEVTLIHTDEVIA